MAAADLGDRLTIIEVPDAREPEIGNSLESMAASEDAVWVVSHRGGIVSRIDTASNEVVATIESPILPSCVPDACIGLGEVATAGQHVWFLNKYSESFKRVDGSSNEIIGSMDGALGFRGLLGAAGLMWSGVEGGDGAVGMDPASGEVTVTVDQGNGLYAAGFAAGSVWFVGDDCRELLRVDAGNRGRSEHDLDRHLHRRRRGRGRRGLGSDPPGHPSHRSRDESGGRQDRDPN